MARHFSILSLLLSIFLASASAWGLALGEIELKSNLNQPFLAEIAVEGATSDDVTGLTVQLASRSAFERLGLDYPDYLQGFDLRTEVRPDGSARVVVTSGASVTEPFVTILVEAVWARGRLLREYTVFLDPPTFVSPAPVPAPVQAPATATQSRTTGTVVRQPPPPAPAPATPTEPPAGEPYDAPGDSYRVQRNDTLWKIADRYRPDQSVSVNQMMMAIYEANPNAFMGRNINLLRAGSILRIPDRGMASALSSGEANAQVARHYDEWRSGAAQTAPSEPVARLELRPPSDDSGSPAAGQPVSGDSELATENDQLRDELATVRSDLEESRRLLELQSQEMAQLQQRLQQLEEAGTVADTGVAVPPAVEPETQPGAEPEAEQAAQPPVPAPTPVQRPAQATGDESLFGKLIGFVTAPFFLILLGLIVIAGALLAVVRRRRAAAEPEVAEPWDTVGRPTEDSSPTIQTRTITELPVRDRGEASIVVEEGLAPDDTGSLEIPAFEPEVEATGGLEFPDFAETAGRAETTASVELPVFEGLDEEQTAAEPAVELPDEVVVDTAASAVDELSDTIMERLGQDQGDPIGEADFHMAYELYDQAADVVKSALRLSPDRRDLLAKLAEIYFVWGNKDQFLDSARRLFESREEGSDAEWNKILIMGKQIAPEEPIFSGELQAAGEEPVDLALEATAVAPPVDLSLAEEADTGVDLDFGDALETGGDTRETPALTEASTVVDDATLADTGVEEEDEGLDFDFTGDTQESPTLESPAAESPTVETPTIETPITEAPTVETPTIETSLTEAPTVETPTVEAPATEAPTVETPTIEAPATEAPTVETPTLETPSPDVPTMETPTLETAGLGADFGLDETVEQETITDADRGVDTTSETAEIELDDLGLDVSLDDSFLGPLDRTGEAPVLEQVDEDLTATDGGDSTGIRKVDFDFTEDFAEEAATADHQDTDTLAATDQAEPENVFGDYDATTLAGAAPEDDVAAVDRDAATAMRIDDTSSIDLDLGDLLDDSEAVEVGDTVEQPGLDEEEATGTDATGVLESPATTGIFESADSTGILEKPDDTAVLDLDVGEELRGFDDDPTSTEVLPEDEMSLPDGEAVTMSEIGTKLDLARAYMDMGDPDGARSILQEVLDEGDEGQRADAQRLMQNLP